MIKCPNCNESNHGENNFCRECGADLSIVKMYCLHCGIVFTDGEKFCTNCGNRLKSWAEYDLIKSDVLQCSECGKQVKTIAVQIHNKCPHCGAKPFKSKY